jgi:putative ABC transport system permease protein
MVLGAGFKLTAIGIAIGVVGSLVAARFLTAFTSLLFGVKPTDALTYVAVVAILAAVSLLACYIPARRAAKVDSMVVLRYE